MLIFFFLEFWKNNRDATLKKINIYDAYMIIRQIQIWMDSLWMVPWPTFMGKCMSFTGAHVLSKWFWQQNIFRLSSGLETALFCPFCVHIILGLVLSSILFFFHFLWSSAWQNHPNLPQGNFQPDTEFLEFTYECESSSKYPGTAYAANAVPCENKTFSCFPWLSFFSFSFKSHFLVQRL